jgi:hypothetical protein
MSIQDTTVEDLNGAVELLKRLKRDLMHTRRFGSDTLATYRRACSDAEAEIEAFLIDGGFVRSNED